MILSGSCAEKASTGTFPFSGVRFLRTEFLSQNTQPRRIKMYTWHAAALSSVRAEQSLVPAWALPGRPPPQLPSTHDRETSVSAGSGAAETGVAVRCADPASWRGSLTPPLWAFLYRVSLLCGPF